MNKKNKAVLNGFFCLKTNIMETFLMLFIIFFLIYLIIRSHNHKKRVKIIAQKKKASEELRLELFEKHKNEFYESLSIVELAPEIFELRYTRNEQLKIKAAKWIRIKKDKIYTYDVNEIVFYFESLPLSMSYTASQKTCIHWHITLPSENLNDLLYDMTLATIYVGEITIEQFKDELEKKKIEEKLIKERRRKELVKIVKKEMEDDE